MEKKQKIELYFRENRIKRFDYESLEWDKLEDNSLICRAYANGKGFIESDNNYI